MVRSLAIITHGYPCAVKPAWLVFVRQIAHAIARQGVRTSVVCPLTLHRVIRGRDAYVSVEDAGNGATVTVYRPRYLSFSSRGMGALNTGQLSVWAHARAVHRVLKRHLTDVDALYGHFLYPAGACAAWLGRKYGLPSFAAVGEGSLNTIGFHNPERVKRDFADITGILPNSTHLGNLLQRELGFDSARVQAFPNGVNRGVFYPRDRQQMRRRFGLPDGALLVACVGKFATEKGQLRICQAMEGLEGVGGVFVGSGDTPPQGDHVLFSRALPHDEVPELLSACDVFVLPTMDEGCCNAILEAMACGLPVVSSTGAFNDDILNADVSFRTDAMDVAGIRAAILCLRDDRERRARMASAALKWSENFDAENRARRILAFMADRIRHQQEKAPA